MMYKNDNPFRNKYFFKLFFRYKMSVQSQSHIFRKRALDQIDS